jgi:hypothetical protein
MLWKSVGRDVSPTAKKPQFNMSASRLMRR